MKIICKKGCNVKSALQIVSEYMEKKSLEYPLIGEDLEIEISLKIKMGKNIRTMIRRYILMKRNWNFFKAMRKHRIIITLMR